MKISNDTLKRLQAEMRSHYGFHIPKSKMIGVLKASPGLEDEIEEMGIDTVVREMTINYITACVGIHNHWPLYGDTAEYTASFYKQFLKKGRQFGLRFTVNWKAHE